MTASPAPITSDLSNRCRLVLVLDGDIVSTLGDNALPCLSAAISGGDVASLILAPGTLDEDPFETAIRPLVSPAQEQGIAVMIAGYSRVAGRLQADGLQLGQNPEAIAEAVEKFAPKIMVGAANVKTRHTALVIGEAGADYLMFGKPGGDTHAEANPKSLALGEWWASMVEIPGIVMGGSDVDSVIAVAKTGCDFVALGSAIFTADCRPESCRAAVAQANDLLDAHAPRFDTPR